jgi:hypothetical protein
MRPTVQRSPALHHPVIGLRPAAAQRAAAKALYLAAQLVQSRAGTKAEELERVSIGH